MMNGREFFSLQRLAAHYGLSRRAVLERLIWWADRSVVQSLGEDGIGVWVRSLPADEAESDDRRLEQQTRTRPAWFCPATSLRQFLAQPLILERKPVIFTFY